MASASLNEDQGLRRRKSTSGGNTVIGEPSLVTDKPSTEEVVWGKTPSGQVFRVPTTHDVLTSLFHPLRPKSHLDLVNLALLGLQIVIYFVLPKSVGQVFFFLYFAFWRAAYDAGLGWVLTKQSKKKWIVREMVRRGWLDGEKRPKTREWIKRELSMKMGKDYDFDDLPLEYNTWLLFRQAVDIILINDFLSYCLFAFSCFRVPDDLSILTHALRWVGGITLIVFNLWVKTEAHKIVKDYGWYWGDVFFERGALVFDGVFEMAPHPMYSVGYAGYYGLSLIVGSYAVLFVSLAAHAAQFAFLIGFENPHIERTYGQKKAIAVRTPLFPSRAPATGSRSTPATMDATPALSRTPSSSPLRHRPRDHRRYMSISSSTDGSTPAITEGDTISESDGLADGLEGTPPLLSPPFQPRWTEAPTSQHDIMTKYFRKDVLGLHNVDLLRASDLQLVLLVFYSVVFALLRPLSPTATLALHFTHALLWRAFHSFGLGLLLKKQSESKWMVRHFMKHYYYPPASTGAIEEAFANWKSIYNLSLCMTYVSFIGLAWKTYHVPLHWTVGDELLRHTLGFLLIFLHVWTAVQSYEVLGAFGWFFGDFFLEDYPAQLVYTGIYRFLNNPERTMSGSTFFGLSLISGSKLAFALAVVCQISHYWFLSNVEDPHMRKVYGDSLRQEAGLTKTIRNVALRNNPLLNLAASSGNLEAMKFASQLPGTVSTVYGDAVDVVEEFVQNAGPVISGVVRQARKTFVMPLLVDRSLCDVAQYQVTVVPTNPDGELKFRMGEPITVTWRAPHAHSRQDWVGIYQLGENPSQDVTTVNSMGRWVPVHDEEWDGDIPVPHTRRDSQDVDCGEITFKGSTLPWKVGKYEIRYHHDGKYNVMSVIAPLEIYVEQPSSMDFESVRAALMKMVVLCLDSDPALVPIASQAGQLIIEDDTKDPDDFSFWNERQARRISGAIKSAFGIDFAPEVIIGDANVSALTSRILGSREILSS